MFVIISKRLACAMAAVAISAAAAAPAAGENIAVGNYGSSANGMPFAVALYKGFFKEEGADVTVQDVKLNTGATVAELQKRE